MRAAPRRDRRSRGVTGTGADRSWVRRTDHLLRPDPDRVVARLFLPGQELASSGRSRAAAVLQRVRALDDAAVERELTELTGAFDDRHHDLEATWETHFAHVCHGSDAAGSMSAQHRRLVGAYFTAEYAVQSAALFNPSMVAHPDQSGLPAGTTRFVMTLRSTGEGHVSSMELRTGTIDVDDVVRFDPPPTRAVQPVVAVEQAQRSDARGYDITFPADSALNERVLMPQTPAERNGVEDVRMVRLEHADGATSYAGTYTAYDGQGISIQLLRTQDFVTMSSRPLSGPGARDKGLAIFPRQVGGRWCAMSRADRESNAVSTSQDLVHWDEPVVVQRPEQGWEAIQLGNCGSPVETERGWLVLTHGVGPMRTYSIGALLLDLDEPTRVVGRLTSPLLTAVGDERSGYVPNVVYSCGAMLHGRTLVLPYGTSDSATRVALVDVDPLLDALVGGR
ncbi:glycoside hydrolase family 130 protein [Cellulomonas xiejunii]|uniref:Glycoside hydrolase family 130 protein n=1 Tax=Cellulomonas xiejunii TaxID=2968083 RepID=A0ABY5KQW6_9CELL|nr:glycoside hydrolase family 130 protein [Cellulomonas xiejunii]MCC2322123.1 glycoside hydrolase family 130 protein [Cellulomonas xiejunii]MCC2323234.1 glycoside hydrolase family 130 protein [Cellulomonas xiejunii]UUI72180.1 glycoside hydrolase family 130 protein [Cellulomonas xiejunii]